MSNKLNLIPEFWRGKRVLVTGHNGFKGAWLTLLLERLGAIVVGVSLPSEYEDNMFEMIAPWGNVKSIECDIREYSALKNIVDQEKPQIVIHMAAQALVFDAYDNPVETITTNTMGTVHLLEALRDANELESVLIITSDKVYENTEEGIDFKETSPLGGHEAYSASKSAAEILTNAYRRTYFHKSNVPIVIGRAGNVIGGGDWSRNRLIPDLWRAYKSQKPMQMRNPDAVRPWQHVLDPVYGYLLYIQLATLNTCHRLPNALNFGPPRTPIKSVQEIAKQFSLSMGVSNLWSVETSENHVKESSFLSIDSFLSLDTLGWKTALSVNEAVKLTCDWYKAYDLKQDIKAVTNQQIDGYLGLVNDKVLSD